MAVYKTWDKIRTIPLHKPIWACAYSLDNNKETMGLKQEPIQGAIIDSSYKTYFYPFRKGSTTEFVSSKRVNYYARVYADTEKECWDLYNQLVQDKITYFFNRIKEVHQDLHLSCEYCSCRTCKENALFVNAGGCSGCLNCRKKSNDADNQPILCVITGDYI